MKQSKFLMYANHIDQHTNDTTNYTAANPLPLVRIVLLFVIRCVQSYCRFVIGGTFDTIEKVVS